MLTNGTQRMPTIESAIGESVSHRMAAQMLASERLAVSKSMLVKVILLL